MSLLEYQHLLIGPGEVISSDKAVVTSTNDDGIVGMGQLLHQHFFENNYTEMTTFSLVKYRGKEYSTSRRGGGIIIGEGKAGSDWLRKRK